MLSGHGRVANDMYGVFDACYPDDFPQREQDIEQARQLLTEAGQEGLTIDLFAPDDTAGLPEMAAAFADQAKEAGVTVNVKVLDGGTYWGEEYTQRTFATSFWGTRPYLNQVAAGSLQTATYPETHWPPEGSNFEELYLQALGRDRRRRPLRDHPPDAAAGVRRGRQHHRPSSTTCSTPTRPRCRASRPRPNVLNLDHFGRGFKNIWLESLRAPATPDCRRGRARGPAEVRSPARRLRRADAVRRLRGRVRADAGAAERSRPSASSAATRPRRASPPSGWSSASTSPPSSSTPTGSAACSPATRATPTPTASRSWTSSATASSTRCSSWWWRRWSRSRCRS